MNFCFLSEKYRKIRTFCQIVPPILINHGTTSYPDKWVIEMTNFVISAIYVNFCNNWWIFFEGSLKWRDRFSLSIKCREVFQDLARCSEVLQNFLCRVMAFYPWDLSKLACSGFCSRHSQLGTLSENRNFCVLVYIYMLLSVNTISVW